MHLKRTEKEYKGWNCMFSLLAVNFLSEVLFILRVVLRPLTSLLAVGETKQKEKEKKSLDTKLTPLHLPLLLYGARNLAIVKLSI